MAYKIAFSLKSIIAKFDLLFLLHTNFRNEIIFAIGISQKVDSWENINFSIIRCIQVRIGFLFSLVVKVIIPYNCDLHVKIVIIYAYFFLLRCMSFLYVDGISFIILTFNYCGRILADKTISSYLFEF